MAALPESTTWVWSGSDEEEVLLVLALLLKCKQVFEGREAAWMLCWM